MEEALKELQDTVAILKEKSEKNVDVTVKELVLAGAVVFMAGMLAGTRWTVKRMSRKKTIVEPIDISCGCGCACCEQDEEAK